MLDFDQSFKCAAKLPFFAPEMVKSLIRQGSTIPSVVKDALGEVDPGDKEDVETKPDVGRVFFRTAVAYLRQATSPAEVAEAASEGSEGKDDASKPGTQGS